MSLDEEYPKSNRHYYRRLLSLLEIVPDLSLEQREDIAMTINAMGDKACDLDEIVQRLVNETHTPAEIGDLLIAFELTTEQIRGHSDTIDGKLYEIGDRLKEIKPVGQTKS